MMAALRLHFHSDQSGTIGAQAESVHCEPAFLPNSPSDASSIACTAQAHLISEFSTHF